MIKAVILWWNGHRQEIVIPKVIPDIKIAVLKPSLYGMAFSTIDPMTLIESASEEAIFWQSGWMDGQCTMPIYTQKSGPDPYGRNGL